MLLHALLISTHALPRPGADLLRFEQDGGEDAVALALQPAKDALQDLRERLHRSFPSARKLMDGRTVRVPTEKSLRSLTWTLERVEEELDEAKAEIELEKRQQSAPLRLERPRGARAKSWAAGVDDDPAFAAPKEAPTAAPHWQTRRTYHGRRQKREQPKTAGRREEQVERPGRHRDTARAKLAKSDRVRARNAKAFALEEEHLEGGRTTYKTSAQVYREQRWGAARARSPMARGKFGGLERGDHPQVTIPGPGGEQVTVEINLDGAIEKIHEPVPHNAGIKEAMSGFVQGMARAGHRLKETDLKLPEGGGTDTYELKEQLFKDLKKIQKRLEKGVEKFVKDGLKHIDEAGAAIEEHVKEVAESVKKGGKAQKKLEGDDGELSQDAKDELEKIKASEDSPAAKRLKSLERRGPDASLERKLALKRALDEKQEQRALERVRAVNDELVDMVNTERFLLKWLSKWVVELAEVIIGWFGCDVDTDNFKDISDMMQLGDTIDTFEDIRDKQDAELSEISACFTGAKPLAECEKTVMLIAGVACNSIWTVVNNALPGIALVLNLLDTITSDCPVLADAIPDTALTFGLTLEAGANAPGWGASIGLELGLGVSLHGQRMCYFAGCVVGSVGLVDPGASVGVGFAATWVFKTSNIPGSCNTWGLGIGIDTPTIGASAGVDVGLDLVFDADYVPAFESVLGDIGDGTFWEKWAGVGISAGVSVGIGGLPVEVSINHGRCYTPICIAWDGSACGDKNAPAEFALPAFAVFDPSSDEFIGTVEAKANAKSLWSAASHEQCLKKTGSSKVSFSTSCKGDDAKWYRPTVHEERMMLKNAQDDSCLDYDRNSGSLKTSECDPDAKTQKWVFDKEYPSDHYATLASLAEFDCSKGDCPRNAKGDTEVYNYEETCVDATPDDRKKVANNSTPKFVDCLKSSKAKGEMWDLGKLWIFGQPSSLGIAQLKDLDPTLWGTSLLTAAPIKSAAGECTKEAVKEGDYTKWSSQCMVARKEHSVPITNGVAAPENEAGNVIEWDFCTGDQHSLFYFDGGALKNAAPIIGPSWCLEVDKYTQRHNGVRQHEMYMRECTGSDAQKWYMSDDDELKTVKYPEDRAFPSNSKADEDAQPDDGVMITKMMLRPEINMRRSHLLFQAKLGGQMTLHSDDKTSRTVYDSKRSCQLYSNPSGETMTYDKTDPGNCCKDAGNEKTCASGHYKTFCKYELAGFRMACVGSSGKNKGKDRCWSGKGRILRERA